MLEGVRRSAVLEQLYAHLVAALLEATGFIVSMPFAVREEDALLRPGDGQEDWSRHHAGTAVAYSR